METTQMMMPMASATPAATASSAMVMPGADCACAGTAAGFGSLLGQIQEQLQQMGISLPITSEGQVAPDVMPMSGADQDMPELSALLSGLVDGATVAADEQQISPQPDEQVMAQQLAGFFQAAMMVPAAPTAATATVTATAVPEPLILADVAAVQTVTTVSPIVTELAEVAQGGEEQISELSQQLVASQPEQQAVMQGVKHGASEMQHPTTVGKVSVNGTQNSAQHQQRESSEQQGVAAVRATETASQPEVVKVAQAGAAPLAEMARSMAAEAPAAPKATMSTVAPFRFAQPSDVVAATAQPGQQQQQNFSQFEQAKGGELAAQTAAVVAVDPAGEAALFELNQNPVNQLETTGLGSLTGLQRQAAQELQAVVEPGRMAPEQQAMKQVTDRLDAHQIKQGADQITLKLSPEHLGNLQLNIRMDDQQVRVEIVAEHRAVRDALLQQVEQLKESLSRQNIKMESFDVTTANNGGLNQQQAGDWRQTASQRRPTLAQQYGVLRAASGSNGEMDGTMQYFGPQYHSTLDVRF